MAKKRKGTFLIVLFAVGVAILLYPSMSNLWNARVQQKLVSAHTEAVETASYEEREIEYEKALAYNNDLWPTPTPEGFAFLNEDDPAPEYMECLNLNGDGIMGYVTIPKLSVEIPIYHTTDEESLQNGAGHLEGTSLPIGGENTHCVIAAHRGLPGHVLFTNLDKMEPGDHFYLTTLGERLYYEVDQILVVEPDDTSDLVIVGGEDYCTLLTCTPYGVNTERLLVRGHRVDEEEAGEDDAVSALALTTGYKLLIFGLVVAALGITAIIAGNRKNRKHTRGK